MISTQLSSYTRRPYCSHAEPKNKRMKSSTLSSLDQAMDEFISYKTNSRSSEFSLDMRTYRFFVPSRSSTQHSNHSKHQKSVFSKPPSRADRSISFTKVKYENLVEKTAILLRFLPLFSI